MHFSIVVYGAPYSSQAASSALRFTRAVIESGHGIYRLFFYLDGVHNASRLVVPPQDEENIPEAWNVLIDEHDIDAVVCVASTLKRGILDEGEARRHDRDCANLLPGFSVSGLGQLVDAIQVSDRVVTFAP